MNYDLIVTSGTCKTSVVLSLRPPLSRWSGPFNGICLSPCMFWNLQVMPTRHSLPMSLPGCSMEMGGFGGKVTEFPLKIYVSSIFISFGLFLTLWCLAWCDFLSPPRPWTQAIWLSLPGITACLGKMCFSWLVLTNMGLCLSYLLWQIRSFVDREALDVDSEAKDCSSGWERGLATHPDMRPLLFLARMKMGPQLYLPCWISFKNCLQEFLRCRWTLRLYFSESLFLQAFWIHESISQHQNFRNPWTDHHHGRPLWIVSAAADRFPLRSWLPCAEPTLERGGLWSGHIGSVWRWELCQLCCLVTQVSNDFYVRTTEERHKADQCRIQVLHYNS